LPNLVRLRHPTLPLKINQVFYPGSDENMTARTRSTKPSRKKIPQAIEVNIRIRSPAYDLGKQLAKFCHLAVLIIVPSRDLLCNFPN
jgi:hypothetical protein